MQTPTILHVPEAAQEALRDGVHHVESLAAHAVQQVEDAADKALDVVLAPLALDFGHVPFDDLFKESDSLS